MTPGQEQKELTAPFEPEFDSTDGGWDPYIAALLTGSSNAPGTLTDDGEDDAAPVMSFSRPPTKAARSR